MPERLVIIPTYNERENIREVIAHVIGLQPAFDLLIVDDGSPDGTAALVKAAQGLHPQEGGGRWGLRRRGEPGAAALTRPQTPEGPPPRSET